MINRMVRRLVALMAMAGSMLFVAAPAWAVEFSPSPDSPLAVSGSPQQQAVVTGDFDGDGDADLAVGTSAFEKHLSVLLRRADGTFGAPTTYNTGGAFSVATGDFNGDQDLDLAVLSFSGEVKVLLGQAGGSFGAPTTAFAVGEPVVQSLVVGDFDDDSDPDLATANRSSDNVSVFLGQAGGAFAAAPGSPFAVGDYPISMATGDFDGDPYPDLAVTNLLSDNVSVLPGAADGSFGAATNYPAGDGPVSVAAGDFDGDLDADLAVANFFSNNVSVLTRGAGGFGVATASSTGERPIDLDVSDFDGDSDPDLAVANSESDNVSVLPGAEGSTFGAAANFPVGDRPYGIAVADFDSNLDPDLAVTNSLSNTVSVLMNTSVPEISPSSTNLDFGSRPVGTIGPAQTVTVTNTGKGHLNVSGVAITGANPGDFIKSGDTCSAPVAPGRSCDVGVRFAPEAVGSRSANLRITTDAPTSPTDVALAGSGSLVAHNDSYVTDQDRTLTVAAPGVLADDAAGPSPTAVEVSGPSDGALTLDADGSFTYTPAPGFSGPDSFEYRAAVGTAQSNVATVLIRVKEADTSAPTVKATTPSGVKVSPSANVTATFSEAMTKASVEEPGVVKLTKKGASTAIPATVTYDPVAKRVTLNPTTSLKKGASYKVTVSSGARDLAGNSLAAAKVWTFTVRK